MPYQIKKYDGTTIATIPEYQFNDTAIPLVLFGQGVTEYGKPMAENLVHMLENFAGPTPPGMPARLGNPIVGQLWYDTATRKLKVRAPTSNWDVVGSANSGPIPPAPPNIGDMWLDTSSDPSRMKVYNGVSWQLVGAAAAASSRTANSVTGNGAIADGNYFTTTATGDNAEPQIGDLWFDPAVGRLKVYNGQYWQFTASASAGFIDQNIPNNINSTPTNDTTYLEASYSGEYHTSATLGPSQGVFATGDLQWDNVRNQLFVKTDNGSELIGPTGAYRTTINGTPRGYTNHLHFTSGSQSTPLAHDLMGVITNNTIMGIWGANNTLYGDLPNDWQLSHGPLDITFNMRAPFDNDSRGDSAYLTPGLNLLSNLVLRKGNLCVGDWSNNSQLFLSNENNTQGELSIQAVRYGNTVSAAPTIDLVRHRGDRASVLAPINGDTLGVISFTSGNTRAASISTTIIGEPGTSGNPVPSKISLSVNNGEKLAITNDYIIGSVNYSAIEGIGNNVGANTAYEYPSYTFTNNIGTGMSSPNGGNTLNLALRGKLLLQLVYNGPSVLYGDWLTTGDHTVNGKLTAAQGSFGTLSATSFNTGSGSVGMGNFMRNDAGSGASSSRTPVYGAALDGTNGLDFGTPSTRWGIFYGVANSSYYGDLAERYEADTILDVGTVVKLGGSKEITMTTTEYDRDVFGVISIKPGMAMNDGAGSNETHPYVALAGRIPCKVIGKVKKGQRVVSSNLPGVAQGANDPPLDGAILSIIGRSLVDKNTDDLELIEIVVGKN